MEWAVAVISADPQKTARAPPTCLSSFLHHNFMVP